MDRKIKIVDSTLRDGNHLVDNEISLKEIEEICRTLDRSGIDYIEVGYKYGIGSNKDSSKPSDLEVIRAAKKSLTKSKLAILVFPEKCSLELLEEIVNEGVDLIRIATPSTNVSKSEEYFKYLKSKNIGAGGFLMMSHGASEDQLLEEASKMVRYGASSITITDSAGAMIPSEVKRKIEKIKNNLQIPVGFHTHDNMGIALYNSITAIESGASFIDASLCGFGAGAGNTKTEYLVSLLKKLGYNVLADNFKVLDSCRLLSKLMGKHGIEVDNPEDYLLLGLYGVYSTFMKKSKEIALEFNIGYRELLKEASINNLGAGEEDKLFDLAKKIQEMNKINQSY